MPRCRSMRLPPSHLGEVRRDAGLVAPNVVSFSGGPRRLSRRFPASQRGEVRRELRTDMSRGVSRIDLGVARALPLLIRGVAFVTPPPTRSLRALIFCLLFFGFLTFFLING